jgi:hypothetical protein
MRRREAEQLATEASEPAELLAAERATTARVPLAELAEAGPEQASISWNMPRPPREIRGPGLGRRWEHGRERGIER